MIEVVREPRALRARCDALRQQGLVLGFVPTMGALHAGHMSLIDHAHRTAPHVAVSIFVKRGKQNRIGDVAVVEVIDEGPGIPREILPRVFDRFTKADGRGGLGLGLYLAKRITAVHGGDLTVDSQPGKGTRFTLSLPTSVE